MRTTHTVARLPISQAAFDEIKRLLLAAGYAYQFLSEDSIDMTGIAVEPKKED